MNRINKIFDNIDTLTNTHGLMSKNSKNSSLPQYILNLDEFREVLYGAYKQQPVKEIAKVYLQGMYVDSENPREVIRTEEDLYIHKISLSFDRFRNTSIGYNQRVLLKIDGLVVLDEIYSGETDIDIELRGELYIGKDTKIELEGFDLDSASVVCNLHGHLVDGEERAVMVICKHRATEDVLKVIPMTVSPIQSITIDAPTISGYILDDDYTKTIHVDYYSDPIIYVEFYYKSEEKTIVISCQSAYDNKILKQETMRVEPPLTVRIEVEETINRPEGEWYIIEDNVRNVDVKVDSPNVITEIFRYKLPEKTVEVNAICINTDTGEHLRSETKILTYETNASTSFYAPEITSHILVSQDNNRIVVNVDRFSADVVNVYFHYYYYPLKYYYLECYFDDKMIHSKKTVTRPPRIFRVEAPDLTGYKLEEPDIPWKHMHIKREPQGKEDLTVEFEYILDD